MGGYAARVARGGCEDRLDIKQNPLYESNGFVLLDTHYYGGIKNYQWVAMPLALHGVVAKTDGAVVQVSIGEDADDPVFCVSDLLPHLGREQMEKTGNKIVEGEALDVLVGNRPLPGAASDADPVFCVSDLLPHLGREQMEKTGNKIVEGEALDVLVGNRPLPGAASDAEPKDPVKAFALQLLADKYGIEEEDFLSAELEVVPAGRAREAGAASDAEPKDPVKAFALQLLADKYGIEEEDFLSAELEVVPAGRAREAGFDRSMIIGYGQDDRVCAYTSLTAQLALAVPGAQPPHRTALTVLVDKEEIGSVGATGMDSLFFENTVAEIMELAGEGGMLRLRRGLAASRMLSSDVSAGFDPAYAGVFETKNAGAVSRRRACSPPTSPPASTLLTPACSRRRTRRFSVVVSCSTSTRGRVGKAAATTPRLSTSPSCAA